MVLLAPGCVAACELIGTPQSVDGTVEVDNADPAGKRLASLPWQGSAFPFRNCTGRQPIIVDVALTGLTYVRDVQMNGLTFPAYGFDATSPLVIFMHNSGHAAGTHSIPLQLGHNLDPNRANSPTVPEVYRSQVIAYAFSRGGVMTPVPYTLLGNVTTTLQNFPALSRTIPVSIGINVLPPTCALSNASLLLDDLSADALRAVGDGAGEKRLDVSMRCPGAGITVSLTLTDASDPGSTGSELAPTSDSTAQGVQIQLLRNAVPVQLGQTWVHGLSVGGTEALTLGARYRRTAMSVVPGEIKGEAVLTATYR